jgi:predicted transcriptional regulator
VLKRITIWIETSTAAGLKKIAKEKERPVGYLIRKAAEEYVAREIIVKAKARAAKA